MLFRIISCARCMQQLCKAVKGHPSLSDDASLAAASSCTSLVCVMSWYIQTMMVRLGLFLPEIVEQKACRVYLCLR